MAEAQDHPVADHLPPVPQTEDRPSPLPGEQPRAWSARLAHLAGWQRYVLSVLLVALATGLGLAFRPYFDPSSNLVIFYLLAVVVAALFWGAGPTAVTSVLSVLAYRLLFVPRFLQPSQIDDYLMFLSVLIVGLVVSRLATSAREQASIAEHRAARLAALYALSGDLAAVSDRDGIAQAIAARTSETLNCDVAVLLPAGDEVAMRAASPGFVLDENDRLRATSEFRSNQPTAPSAGAPPAESHSETRIVPLMSACCAVGVLVVRGRPAASVLSEEQEQLLEAFASLSAVAIERAQLADEARQAYLYRETEKLQTALLNSVSHDLRTPLASITGALTSLLDREVDLDKATSRGLAESAYEETQRLNHLVGNLLDMTRLEAGAMRPEREPCDVQDLIGAALAQLGDRLRQRRVVVDVPILPMVPMDFVLMTQVLVNLLDNALKYSPPDTAVEVSARVTDSLVRIDVADRGVGLAEEDVMHLFDRFYRVHSPGHVAGTGLGLSISKGIVDLHGGRLAAANRPGGGAVFTVELPLDSSSVAAAEAQP